MEAAISGRLTSLVERCEADGIEGMIDSGSVAKPFDIIGELFVVFEVVVCCE